jgi:phosphoribosyl 1,2-cyclic phosphate phosphodiesterase
LKITFLGSGTSQGVPVIGCTCKVCLSQDHRDKRLRASVLISIGQYNILIDVGPDFRQQMLVNQIPHLDAILLTHEHNDHIIGMDDIRPFNFRQKYDMPVYGLPRVLDDIKAKFKYVFEQNSYPGAPKVVLYPIGNESHLRIFDNVDVRPLAIMHGNLPILGYKIGNFAYITDASFISDDTQMQLKNLDVLVLNALQYRKHYSHFTYDEAIEMAQKIGARKTYFTHMSHEIGLHVDVCSKLPQHIFAAYDGLIINTDDEL